MHMIDEKEECILVMTSCPSSTCGENLARVLLETRQAACVNLVEGVTSLYRWKGRIQKDSEALLLVKTTGTCLEAVKGTILKNHPYDLPEIVALPLVGGSEEYLRWLREETVKE